jgi:site-specific recombinase XerD
MYTIPTSTVERITDEAIFDVAEMAAAAFLARYSGRTLDAYRQDLRCFFNWANDVGLEVLAATRPHIELYRQHVEQRALAASTIDRRLSTVCRFYKFAPHRRQNPDKPRPVRAPTQGPPQRRPRARPR